MNYKQDEDTQKLFGLVFVVLPVLYLFVRLLPYVLFYLLPVAVMAGLVALLWRGLLYLSDDGFRWLSVIIPGTFVLVLLVVGFPPAASPIGLELFPSDRFFFDLFNSSNQAIVHFLWRVTPMPFDSLFGLKAKANPALYSWDTVRVLVWLSVGLVAHIFLAAWAEGKEQTLKVRYGMMLEAEVENQKRSHTYWKAGADMRLDELTREKRENQYEMKLLRAEIERWKTLAEFKEKTEGSTEKERAERTGVLDSDAL